MNIFARLFIGSNILGLGDRWGAEISHNRQDLLQVIITFIISFFSIECQSFTYLNFG
jgi:hypothetical protein